MAVFSLLDQEICKEFVNAHVLADMTHEVKVLCKANFFEDKAFQSERIDDATHLADNNIISEEEKANIISKEIQSIKNEVAQWLLVTESLAEDLEQSDAILIRDEETENTYWGRLKTELETPLFLCDSITMICTDREILTGLSCAWDELS